MKFVTDGVKRIRSQSAPTKGTHVRFASLVEVNQVEVNVEKNELERVFSKTRKPLTKKTKEEVLNVEINELKKEHVSSEARELEKQKEIDSIAEMISQLQSDEEEKQGEISIQASVDKPIKSLEDRNRENSKKTNSSSTPHRKRRKSDSDALKGKNEDSDKSTTEKPALKTEKVKKDFGKIEHPTKEKDPSKMTLVEIHERKKHLDEEVENLRKQLKNLENKKKKLAPKPSTKPTKSPEKTFTERFKTTTADEIEIMREILKIQDDLQPSSNGTNKSASISNDLSTEITANKEKLKHLENKNKNEKDLKVRGIGSKKNGLSDLIASKRLKTTHSEQAQKGNPCITSWTNKR